MTQSVSLKLFIKGAIVGSWDREQALEAGHQEAVQKVLSKATLNEKVEGEEFQELLPTPRKGPGMQVGGGAGGLPNMEQLFSK